MNLTNKRVLLTGGSGFLGTHLIKTLIQKGCRKLFTPASTEYDLRERSHIADMLLFYKPDVIIHAAATVGGIGANMDSPGTFFYENAVMGIELLELARQFKIEKFVQIGTTCSYPKFTSVPFKEEDLWSGYPEETNAPYGVAKKMLLVQAQAYRKQYGFNTIYLIPTNLYGPGDNFDLEKSHVIPALIRKMIENPTGEIVIWGTGTPTRDFLYVTDAAEGIVKATEAYDSEEPVNMGSGNEISIQNLVQHLIELTNFSGKIIWDRSKPDGQPRRCLDTSRAKAFGWEATTPFATGLLRTIQWYQEKSR